MSTYIKQKATEAKVPVIVSLEDMVASGGYWLACTGSEIYAARSSIVGSIGVMNPGRGFHQLIEKWEIDNRTLIQYLNQEGSSFYLLSLSFN